MTLFSKQPIGEEKIIEACPYCRGKDIVKSGRRDKKFETIQIYYCKNCAKKFTPAIIKNKTFPLRVILDALTCYNRLNTLEESASKVSEKYGIKLSPQNISNWLEDFKDYLSFLRMRDFIVKKYNKKEVFVESTFFHGQIYNFKYHRAKTDLILEDDFKHYKFRPLREFLELVTAECPHQLFKESARRASEYKDVFNLDTVRITRRENTAVKNTRMVMQAVANNPGFCNRVRGKWPNSLSGQGVRTKEPQTYSVQYGEDAFVSTTQSWQRVRDILPNIYCKFRDNELRHEILQEYMLVNDSVTVAVELPILLDKDDLLHYQHSLNFDVPLSLEEEEVITGHIDLVQIRNGSIHILDYKPSAKKEKPVEQLTIYALALSRLTGLRLFHFKCAWFDEEDYFEFFPLHVVYKKRSKKRKEKISGSQDKSGGQVTCPELVEGCLPR